MIVPFNRRLRAAFTLSIVLVIVGTPLAVGFSASASSGHLPESVVENSSTTALSANGIIVSGEIKHDISPLVRDMPIVQPVTADKGQKTDQTRHQSRLATPPMVNDPVVQQQVGLNTMPPTIVNFLALIYQFTSPPDTTAEVGSTQFVEMTNASFQAAYQVWDKHGISLYGPVTIGGIWAGFGGSCELNDTAYPLVLYDHLAHRWLLTDLTQGGSPTYECIALSTADDATGSWYRYAFPVETSNLPDYPQLSVWPDGYYMTARVGSAVRPYVFDRAHMLLGQTATFQTTASPISGYSSMLPADLDGTTLPPGSAPNYEVALDSADPNFTMFKFHVDWNNPANTTFTAAGSLIPASYNPLCGGGVCIPQPGTGIQLDGLGDRPMMRGAYRNFGDHEAMTFTFSVDAGGGRAGVRWYEIRNLQTTATIFQQGTFAPADGNYRWMGSAAMDHVGNLAIGYTVSSSTTYPSIDYAGRLAGDPLGQLSQGEGSIISGTHSLNTSDWGRYANLSIDPGDDCTFYHVNQYVFDNGQWAGYWATRVGAFKFPNCNLNPTPTATLGGPSATPTSTTLTPTPTLTATPLNPTSTATPAVTGTASPTPTATPAITGTLTPTATNTPPPATPTDCANPFTDISGNIFYSAIHYLGCRGVVGGLDPTHYGPAAISTRAQFAKVAVLGFAIPSYTPAAPDFVDVPPTYFAYMYIESGFHASILSGYDSATCAAHGLGSPCYLPNVAITRGQLTKLVVGAAHYALYTPTGGIQTFRDVPPTNVFFVSIETAHNKGVINGYPDQTFRPNNNIRRDEMAQIVYKGVTTP